MRNRTLTPLSYHRPVAKLALVGLDFTGTSLGLALRSSKLFGALSGFDAEPRRLEAARRIGAIDEPARSAADAVQQASIVVVTEPDLDEAFRAIAPALSPGAVVTETTLWKRAAQEAARALPPGVHFIGGRPILDHTGSEPDAAAFREAVWCLTPSPETPEAAVNALSAVVSAAGAQPFFLDPAEHDSYTAAVELLPGAMLGAAMRALTTDPAWPEAGKLAGQRFHRFAALVEELPPEAWPDPAGRDATLQALARWRRDKRLLLPETPFPEKQGLLPRLLKGR
jgi:prephenate dehydrogenase